MVTGRVDAPLLGAGRPNSIVVQAAAPDRVGAVERAVVAAIGSRYRPFITSPAALRTQALSQIRGFFSIALVLLALAGVIGLMGLGNTLVVSCWAAPGR